MAAYYAVDGGTGSDTSTVWAAWSGSTSTTTIGDYIWVNWNSTSSAVSDTTTYTSTSANDIWYVWTDATNQPTQYAHVRDGRVVEHRQTIQLTPEQIEEQRLAEARRLENARLAQEKRERERREAEARAELLLVENLTEAQRADFKEFGFFFVESKRPGRRYRLRKGRSGNVDIVENGRVVNRLCAHPDAYVPDDDTRLSQKLMLELMEDAFLGRANRHGPPYHEEDRRVPM